MSFFHIYSLSLNKFEKFASLNLNISELPVPSQSTVKSSVFLSKLKSHQRNKPALTALPPPCRTFCATLRSSGASLHPQKRGDKKFETFFFFFYYWKILLKRNQKQKRHLKLQQYPLVLQTLSDSQFERHGRQVTKQIKK